MSGVHLPRRPEDYATTWFVVLESALQDGDLRRAAEAHRELRRLGVEVTFHGAALGGRGRVLRAAPDSHGQTAAARST